VLLPFTEAGDLDEAYWHKAAATHTRRAGHDADWAAALAALEVQLVVPAFGPVLRDGRLAAALGQSAPIGASVRDASDSDAFGTEARFRTGNGVSPPPSATDSLYRARMEELLGSGW